MRRKALLAAASLALAAVAVLFFLIREQGLAPGATRGEAPGTGSVRGPATGVAPALTGGRRSEGVRPGGAKGPGSPTPTGTVGPGAAPAGGGGAPFAPDRREKLAVIVVEPDGTPVAAADVRLAPEVVPGEMPEDRVGVTDESGQVEFLGLFAGRWRIAASKSGWLNVAGATAAVPAPAAEVVTMPRDEHPPRVTVIDAAGSPVTGARIDAMATLPGGALPGPAAVLRVTTDADGEALLTGLPAADDAVVRLQASSPGKPPAEMERTAGSMRTSITVIQLEAGAALGGTVVDAAGATLSGVRLTLLRTAPGGAALPPGASSSRFELSSIADGSFRFTALPRGEYTLHADGGERGGRRIDGIAAGGDGAAADLRVELAPAGTLEAAAGKAPPAPLSVRPLSAGRLPGTGAIAGRLSGTPPTTAYTVGLAHEGAAPERFYRQPAGAREFHLRNVPAGSWQVLLLVEGEVQARSGLVTVVEGKETGPVELAR